MKNNKFSIKKMNPYVFRLIVIIAALLIFIAITKGDRFYTPNMVASMGSQLPEFGMLALGLVMCMITGGIDLSGVGVANLTSVTALSIMVASTAEDGAISGGAIFLAIVMAFVIGVCAGLLNGFLVAHVRIPPILATLGTFEMFTGIALVVSGGTTLTGLPASFAGVLTAKIGGVIPFSLILFVGAAVIIGLLMSKTKFGREILMIGSNETAAKFSGLKISFQLIRTYIYAGILATIAGLIMLGNYNSAKADYGSQYTMQCVLIAVLGGTDPNGGRGTVLGCVLSIIVMQFVSSIISLFPVSSYYTTLIQGAILIVVMVVDYYQKTAAQRKITRMAKKQAAATE